ncbi:MAG: site-2 protease family protein [Gammaproteobacteria bacterium]|nr:site-2 protease family protein [Gammaproteobacteria bacterium]NIM72441.1 site-2 protease family protein [Gammaproteobacteria bacterium]NIN37485.1 site-2 protease family protein [Gammaproteobacteria bacterium]NIO24198.1 site-2 protease family protein [Gammaproteobacteria bacterium]NIO64807.1 site-2 protease family protein [Gammaproteobacteria bacterium]
MIHLIYDGYIGIFVMVIIALVMSLCLHEFGHALVAKLYGDDTAQKAGRLTLNPLVHIDPMGLLMVVFVGFGYARPVPTDPRNFNSRWAEMMVSAAGPAMNLLLAILTINFYVLGIKAGIPSLSDRGPEFFFLYLAQINLLLMIFNLLPIGALDGHYILPYFLPRELAARYRYYNARYGNLVLLALIGLYVVGLPVFDYLLSVSNAVLPLIIFV